MTATIHHNHAASAPSPEQFTSAYGQPVEHQDQTAQLERRLDPNAPEHEIARKAIDNFFEWIEYSPNNPTYLHSDRYLNSVNWLNSHAKAIEDDIVTRLGDLDHSNIQYDAGELRHLFDPTYVRWRYDNGAADNGASPWVSEAKMYYASDIAYAGIRDIENRAERHTGSDTDISPEEAGKQLVEAIGAQVVRMMYLGDIATLYPDSLSEKQLQSFEKLYRQNITAKIQRGALVQQAANRRATSLENPDSNIIGLRKTDTSHAAA